MHQKCHGYRKILRDKLAPWSVKNGSVPQDHIGITWGLCRGYIGAGLSVEGQHEGGILLELTVLK